MDHSNTATNRTVISLTLIASMAAATTTIAADTNSPPAVVPGLIPIPDYSGDFWTRSRLTGDWWGARTNLANKGVQFDVDWTQYAQGIPTGGLDQRGEYGGHFDYLVRLDLMRMNVI